jgi:hypothetical protein
MLFCGVTRPAVNHAVPCNCAQQVTAKRAVAMMSQSYKSTSVNTLIRGASTVHVTTVVCRHGSETIYSAGVDLCRSETMEEANWSARIPVSHIPTLLMPCRICSGPKLLEHNVHADTGRYVKSLHTYIHTNITEVLYIAYLVGWTDGC